MRWMGAPVLALLMVVSGCAGTYGADPAIPDDVLLTAADFGAQPSQGGPDAAVHPLPPRPCEGPSPSGDAALAERSITADDGTHLAYEYVARYPDSRAAAVYDDLVAGFDRCKAGQTDGTGPENRYRVVARYAAGVLVERDYDSFTSSYFVGHAGE